MSKKRFLGVLLGFALVLGMMLWMSVSAYAAENTVTEKTVTWSNDDLEEVSLFHVGDSRSIKGITVTMGGQDGGFWVPGQGISLRGGTTFVFSSSVGKISKITILASYIDAGSSFHNWDQEYDYKTDAKLRYNKDGTEPASDSVTLSGQGGTAALSCIEFTLVETAVESVSLNKSSTTLIVGDKETLTATVKPDDAKYKTVKWSSDKPEFAEVDASGVVTAVAEGEATITATATNGTDNLSDDKTATCKVTVNSPKTDLDGAPVVLNTSKPLVYNGKARKPVIKTIGGETLTEGTDYTISYAKGNKRLKGAPINAGKYAIIVTGTGNYIGETSATFAVNKAVSSMTATGKTVKIKSKSKKLRKTKTISAAKAYKIKKAVGTLTYKKANKSGKSMIKVNAKTGKITLKKGLKRATYKVKVRVTDAGDANHKGCKRTMTVTIKVKK